MVFRIAQKYSDIQCLEHIVMPNHFHCIIQNVGADLRVCPNVGANLCVRPNDRINLCVCPFYTNRGEHAGSPLRNIVQWFKTMTTNDYIRNVKQNG